MSEPELRRAASVIAARPGADGPEILVLERSGSSRFLPGYVVFPGGAVDPDDEVLAGKWFDDPTEAARAAAVRELVEEAGLGLTSEGLVEVDAVRLDPVHASPPASTQLEEIAHWVAPPDIPVRFDARYFAVEAPLGIEPTADGAEAVRAWWVSPTALLREWEAGERKLYWPTWLTLTQLALTSSVSELLALRIDTREPTLEEQATLPRSVMEQD